ncbi:MAG: ComF family protein [Clostridiales bacterium]|nr:ComF family protein [Clostridiales bacterium]
MNKNHRLLSHAVFPPTCVFCRALLTERDHSATGSLTHELSICPACLARLPYKVFAAHETPCLSNPYEEDPIPDFKVLVPFRYEGEIVSALRALKFHDAPYVAETLSFFMAESVNHSSYFFDAVIPVPLSSARLRRRGYNQAGLLARSIARRIEKPCPENFLIRNRNTRQQSRYKDPMLRAANVKGSFAVPDNVSVDDLSILLVDDVFTTGNTLHEAALALYEAKAGNVVAITAASGREEVDGKGFLTQKASKASRRHRA